MHPFFLSLHSIFRADETYLKASAASLAEIRKRVELALTVYNVHRDTRAIEELTALLQGKQHAPDYLNVDGS